MTFVSGPHLPFLLLLVVLAVAVPIVVAIDAQSRWGGAAWLWGVVVLVTMPIGLVAYVVLRVLRPLGPALPGQVSGWPQSTPVGQTTPDGAYRWDGVRWVPNLPPSGPPGPPAPPRPPGPAAG